MGPGPEAHSARFRRVDVFTAKILNDQDGPLAQQRGRLERTVHWVPLKLPTLQDVD